MPQLLQQLRHLSLEYNVPELYGTLTNYQEWYFVKYNQKSELEDQYKQQIGEQL